MIEPVTLGLLLLLGAWAALDTTSAGQFMISRPLVSGTLAGWILGDPATGLLAGALLEGMDLGGVPAGGARLPEPGPAAVPAVLAAVELGGGGGLALGLGIGVVWSRVGGSSMELQRRLNGVVTRGIEEGRITPRGIAVRHWSCLGLDGCRGMVLTALGIASVWALPSSLPEIWPLERGPTAALFVLPAAYSAGSLLRSWRSPLHRGALFLAGLIGGSFLAALLA